MTFYNRMAGTARSLLDRYGQKMVFQRPTSGEFNPDTGEVEAAGTVTITLVGISQSYTTEEVNGNSVLSTDRKLTVEATGEVPEVGDTVTLQNTTYHVHKVDPLAPAGQAVIYKVQARL